MLVQALEPEELFAGSSLCSAEYFISFLQSVAGSEKKSPLRGGNDIFFIDY